MGVTLAHVRQLDSRLGLTACSIAHRLFRVAFAGLLGRPCVQIDGQEPPRGYTDPQVIGEKEPRSFWAKAIPNVASLLSADDRRRQPLPAFCGYGISSFPVDLSGHALTKSPPVRLRIWITPPVGAVLRPSAPSHWLASDQEFTEEHLALSPGYREGHGSRFRSNISPSPRPAARLHRPGPSPAS